MLTTVTCRPLVLTPKAHLSVSAIKVLPEMAYLVQVITNSSRMIFSNIFFDMFDFIDIVLQSQISFKTSFIHTDIDECTSRSHNCDPILATCNNTFGSFLCTCIQGFSGDGVMCSGETKVCFQNICTGFFH